MKQKLIAVILSLVLLLSCPLAALAASTRIPEFSAVVTAVQADLNDRVSSIPALSRLSVSLLRTITQKLKNTEITVDDVKAAADEASVIMAKLYAAMGSRAEKLLAEAKDRLTPAPSTPAEPSTSAPDTPAEPSTSAPDTPTEPSTSAPDTPTEPSTPTTPSDPGTPSGPSDPTEPTRPTEPAEPTEPESTEAPDETEQITFADLSDTLKKYIFIKVDNADEVAALIAESCDFTYTTVNGEDGTVYIRVNIEENPEIFNYGVFRRLVEDLYEKQGEEMLKNDDGSVDYLMSYEHIAGELALHAMLYAAANEFLRLSGVSSSRLLKLYKAAAVADLNIDEARIPTEIISITGIVLMNFFSFHLLNALGLI